MADVTKVCVVCGAESHRDDWINKQGEFVACDSHTAGEFSSAIAKTKATPSAVTVQPTAPAQAKTAS